MAVTTTLKLPEVLKARIAASAQASGMSPHVFMPEALEAQARLAKCGKLLSLMQLLLLPRWVQAVCFM